MAQRLIVRPASITLGDFDRAFDELFEDLLISRWHGRPPRRVYQDALLVDRETSYEVTIAAAGVDSKRTEIEAGERRLRVRLVGRGGVVERIFDFPHRIEPDQVTARLVEATLLVVLPKKPGRKIRVE